MSSICFEIGIDKQLYLTLTITIIRQTHPKIDEFCQKRWEMMSQWAQMDN